MRKIVGDWKKAGFARETTSPYASPVLLVKKKNGDDRLVNVFRRLNKQIERISFPLPNLDECMEALHGTDMFATIDLAHGYLQIALT